MAIKKVTFKDEGFNILVKRKSLFINGVARRFPVFPRKGPAISPLIRGMTAEEIIKLVRRKLAFLYFSSRAENKVKRAVKAAPITIADVTAKKGEKSFIAARVIAEQKPPA